MAVEGRKRSGISVEKNSAEGTEGEGGIVGIPWKMRIVEFARQQAVVFLNNAKNSWNPQGLEHFLPESEKHFFFFLRFHKVFVKRLDFVFSPKSSYSHSCL